MKCSMAPGGREKEEMFMMSNVTINLIIHPFWLVGLRVNEMIFPEKIRIKIITHPVKSDSIFLYF